MVLTMSLLFIPYYLLYTNLNRSTYYYYIMMMMIEPELLDYNALDKEFENKDLELIGIKYINNEPIYLVRKIK